MNNPFEFGRELRWDELADRQEEVATVVQTVEQGSKLFLIGPRRYGKTSLLKVAGDRLEESGAVILRFDAESYSSIDQLVTALISASAAGLKGPVERVGDQVRSFFSRLRPEMSFNVTQDAWSAKLGMAVASSPEAHVGLLVEALNGLENLAAAQPKGQAVGLIIDEFQRVIDLGGAEAESQIRAAIQRHRRVGYVFAGSNTRMLTAMTMDATRPFYRLGTVHFLGPVPAADFAEFLTRRFTESGFRIADAAAITSILSFAEEVPYNVQMLAHTCWNILRSKPTKQRATLDSGVVAEAMELIVRRYDQFYTKLWTDLTSIQQKTLVAVVLEGGMHLQSHKVAQMVGKGASSVQRALGAMMQKEILREEQHEGGVRLRFEDPFFAQWVRMFPGSVAGGITTFG